MRRCKEIVEFVLFVVNSALGATKRSYEIVPSFRGVEMNVEIPIKNINVSKLIGPKGRTVKMIRAYCSVRMDCQPKDNV